MEPDTQMASAEEFNLINDYVYSDFSEDKSVMGSGIARDEEGTGERSEDFADIDTGKDVEGEAELSNDNRGGESNFSLDFLWKEEESHSSGSREPFSPPWVCWSTNEAVSEVSNSETSDITGDVKTSCLECGKIERELEGSSISEIEMMKERFSKLLLGEDMSGSGGGVCTALAISNAITNLFATLFGQIWRLEPLPPEKRTMWRREMELLLCVSDHIVELIPTCQTFTDGTQLEVMNCRPRSDLYANLPALRKLDNMLLEILDSFGNAEFWYVDQGILAPDAPDGSPTFHKSLQRQEEKWWLPVPRVPPGGLRESSRRQLQHKRDSTKQILKAAMAINSSTLAEMEVPDSYLENLPKNGRACLGDLIHRCITSDQFSPNCFLACFDLTSEHQALEIANKVEASIYVWRRRTVAKPMSSMRSRSVSKSSWNWEMVKDLMVDGEKRELLADRAETLLLCLKQRFPALPQTTLDTSKIQYNKDVGKSILEGYSRILESLAFNIVARIDDLVYADDLMRHSDHFSKVGGMIARKSGMFPYLLPVTATPYKTAFTTPNFSPAQRANSMTSRVDWSPLVKVNNGSRSQPRHAHGPAVKMVLTDYLNIDVKGKSCGIPNEGNSNTVQQLSGSQMQDSGVEEAESCEKAG